MKVFDQKTGLQKADRSYFLEKNEIDKRLNPHFFKAFSAIVYLLYAKV